MKKLISILLFSAICIGAKALGSDPTLVQTWGAHHMGVTTRLGKTVSFEDQSIEFHAYNHLNDEGYIQIRIYDESPEAYKKVKQMMDEIQAKIKFTPPVEEDNFYDKNGIHHYTTKAGDRWNGYLGSLWFQYSDIEQIDLY